MIRRRAAASLIALVLVTAGVGAFAAPPREGFPADPPAHATEKQWVFDVAWDKGASAVAAAKSASAKKPIATARAMGRFALELWVGKELLDRVRFDVPLLGDDTPYRKTTSFFKKPTFQRVTTTVKVQMADSPRATVLAFVDRSTGETKKYFWPPDEKGQLTPFSAKSALGDASATPAGSAAPNASAAPTTSATPAGTAAPTTSAAPNGSAAPAGSSAPTGSASPAGAPAPTSAPLAPTNVPVAPTSVPVAPTSAPVAPKK